MSIQTKPMNGSPSPDANVIESMPIEIGAARSVSASKVDNRIKMSEVKAVILAGGRGTRLRPYTLVLPKPLIPVGGQPIIGHLVKQLRRYGVMEVFLTLGYYGGLIKAFFEQEIKEGLQLHCVEERDPLGTIGPLSLIGNELSDPFIVANGDIVTDLDFRRFVDYHNRRQGVATIACYKRSTTVPYGVLKRGLGGRLLGFKEKPTRTELVSMGIYVFSREILQHVPSGVPFGADDLMQVLLEKDLPVNVYEHKGLWLDIGRVQDLQSAQDTFDDYRHRITGD